MKFSAVAMICLRRIAVLLLLPMAMLAPDAYAQTHYVYIYSSRPPGRIFSDGFQALGNDLNLLNHISGNKLMTGFVTVTANYQNARYHAETSLRYTSERPIGYIYRISADRTYYEVNPSIRYFFQQQTLAGTVGSHRSLMHNVRLLLPLESSENLVATQGIAPAMIQSSVQVRLVSRPDGTVRLVEGEHRDNTNWVGYDDTRTSNPNPYPIIWPDDGTATSSGRCTPPLGDIDEEGVAGGSCSDVYALSTEATVGIERAMRYYGPFDFADCSSSSSSRQEKRENADATCPRLRLFNLSRQMRALSLITADF